MPKRRSDLRVRYSSPMTGSILPTKTDVRWVAPSIHSSCASSTSNESPKAKSRPRRGAKLTLAVANAPSATDAVRRTLTSLAMKLGAP